MSAPLPRRASSVMIARRCLGRCCCSRAARPSRPMAAWIRCGQSPNRRSDKDVVALRSETDAAAASAIRCAPSEKTAHRRQRRADRAAQQSRPAGGLQRARHLGSRDGAGEPAAQSDLFARAHRGRRRARDRAPHRRQHSRSSRRCRRAPKSRPTVSARRSCRRRRRPCGSPPRRAAPTSARSPRARWSASLDAGARRRRNRGRSSPSASAKPAR